jgi:hypothetical protein
VAGRLENAEDEAPEADLLAVAHGEVRESHPALLAEDDRGARSRRQFVVSADEVGVQVRLEDPADGEPLRPGLVEVLVHVAARVHDGRLAGVADQVGRVREATHVELSEVHGAPG